MTYDDLDLPEDAEAPDTDDLIYVTVTGVHSDHGSVVLFEGVTNDGEGRELVFAVDHRPAQDLDHALHLADYDIEVGIEPWQVVRG